MKNLNIAVDNKVATYLQRDGEIVCGNSDYQITFTFDADWDKHDTKTARFIWNGKHMDIPFSGDVCQVPKIKKTGSVTVGVYAGDISTTTPAVIPCKRSIRCDETEMHEENPEVCRDQAIEAAERAEAAAQRAEEAGLSAEDGKLYQHLISFGFSFWDNSSFMWVGHLSVEIVDDRPDAYNNIDEIRQQNYVGNLANGHMVNAGDGSHNVSISSVGFPQSGLTLCYCDYNSITHANELLSMTITDCDVMDFNDTVRDISLGVITVGGGSITVDQTFQPNSPNAQSGQAVEEAVNGVQSQIPLVTLYTLEFGKAIAVGEINEFKFIAFNRTPVVGERFFAYCIEKATQKSFHISAVITEIKEATETTQETAVFEITEAVQCGGTTTGVPDYVLAEAEEVADKVLAVRNADSFVMALASDLHTNGSDQSAASVLHAGQGMDAIASLTQLDLVALLGDYEVYYFDDGTVNGGKPNDTEDARKSFKHIKKTFSSVAKGVPFMQLQGNHDKITTGYEVDMAQTCYAYIGANNVGTVTDYPNKHRIYGYRDFENYKIRVIYLNTTDVTDNTSAEYNVSQAQLTWLKDVALNLTDKDWGIIVLTHHPLNWYGMTNLLNALDEYKGQGSGAKLIAHFHGHLHNFRVETLGTNGVVSITIPNACDGRENEYGTSPSYQDKPTIIANYGDTDKDGNQRKFEKDEGKAEDTAFNVVVVDRQNEQIHCINYGAGIDRIVSFDGEVWEEGEEPPVTPDEPDTPDEPTAYTNQIPISTDASGAVYNGVGWKADTYISSTGGVDSAKAGHGATGFMPIGVAPSWNRGYYVAYFKNIETYPTDDKTRIAFYDADKSYIYQINSSHLVNAETATNSDPYTYTLNADGTIASVDFSIYTISLVNQMRAPAFVRFSAPGIDGDSIITINESIE